MGPANMIKIAVCDDEPAMCDQMAEMTAHTLRKWKEPFEIVRCLDPKGVLEKIQDLDLLFLDIQMPGLYGISFAKILRKSLFIQTKTGAKI